MQIKILWDDHVDVSYLKYCVNIALSKSNIRKVNNKFLRCGTRKSNNDEMSHFSNFKIKFSSQ